MNHSFSLKIAAKLDSLDEIHHFVAKTVTTLNLKSEAIYEVRLATEEAITNIIRHGYQNQEGEIEIEIGKQDDALVVRLRDSAMPFDPTAIPPPDLTKPLAARPIGGMGVYLMKQTMDEVIHRVTASGGNELIMVKRSKEKQ